MKILITGASGLVGSAISKLCIEKNYEVYALTRNVEKSQEDNPFVKWIEWSDYSHPPKLEGISSINVVINLIGENLGAKRWSAAQKKEIYNSRIVSTRNLILTLKEKSINVDTFISTSAIGIYGDHGDSVVTEEQAANDDYVGNLCKDWEEEALKSKSFCKRVVIFRVGIVVSKESHFIKKLLPIFKLGLGGKLGSGKFYMSWIHLKDLVNMYLMAIEKNELEGVYNAVAPFPERNKKVTSLIASRLGKNAIFQVPKFALKIGVGEFASHLLTSSKVSSKKIENEDFYFYYPTLKNALKEAIQ
jgi:uncharacterized protein (TIGR01777 family)